MGWDWLAVIGVGMMLAICLFPLLNSAAWDGHANVRLDFVVIDAASLSPIPGARVRLTVETEPKYLAVTDADGHAIILPQVMTGGRTSFMGLRDTRAVIYPWALEAEASGYQPFAEALRSFTEAPSFHDGSTPPPITIRLRKS